MKEFISRWWKLLSSRQKIFPCGQDAKLSAETDAEKDTESPEITPERSQDSTCQKPRLIVGNYQLHETIGAGIFGKVKLGIHLHSGEKVAVKIFHKTNLEENSLRMISREISIMKKMHHPNIVKLYEVIDTRRYIFLVMEFLEGGELMDLVTKCGHLPEDQARKFFREIVSALDYAHSLHVIHRDLKPENILLDSNLNLKLIDFGLSNTFVPGQFLSTYCGSPSYSAPELIRREVYEGPEVDVWSLGVVLYVLLTGKLPFNGATYLEMYKKILSGVYESPKEISEGCKDLLQRILVVDVKQRASLDQIKGHTWFTENEQQNPPKLNYLNTNGLDPSILQRMTLLNFDITETTQSVLGNVYDAAYATYWILLNAMQKNVGSNCNFKKEIGSLRDSANGSRVM